MDRESPGTGAIAAAPSALRQRRVYVVDDDADLRKSLHFLLASSAITAWPFAEGADFLDQLPGLVPAPILLDVRMPTIDGLAMLSILNQRAVDWPVIVMTAHGDVTIAVRAMKLGAIDFLEKPFKPDLLDHMLDHAFGLLAQADRSRHAREDARRLIGQLSRRELQIVTILLEGVPNKVAAHRLDLSARTVEMHRANALAKLGLKSIAEVIALVTTAETTLHMAPSDPEVR